MDAGMKDKGIQNRLALSTSWVNFTQKNAYPDHWEGNDLKRITVHEWRNWLLEHLGADKYELTRKSSLSVHTIVARDGMDAEKQAQQVIRDENAKEP